MVQTGFSTWPFHSLAPLRESLSWIFRGWCKGTDFKAIYHFTPAEDLTVYFFSLIEFLCPDALCIKAISITSSHAEGEVAVTHTAMVFCSPFGAVLPGACPHSWLSTTKGSNNQPNLLEWVICSQRALWAHKVVAGRKRPTGEPGGQQTFAFHYKWVQGKWTHPSMGCQIRIQSYFPPPKPNILPFFSLLISPPCLQTRLQVLDRWPYLLSNLWIHLSWN